MEQLEKDFDSAATPEKMRVSSVELLSLRSPRCYSRTAVTLFRHYVTRGPADCRRTSCSGILDEGRPWKKSEEMVGESF